MVWWCGDVVGGNVGGIVVGVNVDVVFVVDGVGVGVVDVVVADVDAVGVGVGLVAVVKAFEFVINEFYC